MEFLIDAQLPFRLKNWLNNKGFDALHADDLPGKSKTGDIEIADFADLESRIVITKDRDFLKLRILQTKPQNLLLITTGNINNKDLLALFERNFEAIQKLFASYNVVEMNNRFVVGHRI